MTTADKLKAVQAKRRNPAPPRLISVQVYEGARLAEDAAINPETVHTWFVQQASRLGVRLTGITIHATPDHADDPGQMKGDR